MSIDVSIDFRKSSLHAYLSEFILFSTYFILIFPLFYFVKHAGGGYVVTPINQGKQSLVKHMLSVDWKFWKLHLRPSSARAITIRMLERVAGRPLLITV